ncbi:uncharacterized protein LOC113551049 [Rhopalosiphum maidis]|uniref:uncharacterized protein LOC113551049 n=1 Tax=Rhopalosiphum maidis TaxID=43146 RepID=UPI000F004580|nr:uncharacterized protein LOC113551049 [Rhopalosiphum maidis]
MLAKDFYGIAHYGYTHNTVNHSEDFVDPLTQAHTQWIESLWRPLRLKVVKNMCGTFPDLLPKYLTETWYRGINKSDLFNVFLRDIAEVFV